MKNNNGFSLIELIIVIAIMAVLVAVIVPNLSKYLGKSKVQVDIRNLDEIKHQIMNSISKASIDGIDIIDDEDGIKTAEYIIGYSSSQGKVVAATGTNGKNEFADLLTDSLYDVKTESKLDSGKKRVRIIISGQQSAGYSVTAKFIS